MAPLKAPGPNGMPLIFFQHYWDSIGNDIVKAVLFFLNAREVLSGLNHTLHSSRKSRARNLFLNFFLLRFVMSYINLSLKFWLTN